MKKLFLLLPILFIFNFLHAQFTLEHSYPRGSFVTKHDQLYIVDFEVEGPMYVKIDRHNHNISIYDLNHSLFKSMQVIDSLMNDSVSYEYGELIYFSEHLFNSDDKIEFMLCNFASTYVFNQDGDILFYKWAQLPAIHPNYHQQQFPIYNTPNGTKMILSGVVNDSAYVYAISGTWSGIQPTLSGEENDEAMTKIYPNPSSEFATINYSLPEGINSGEIIFYNTNGTEIKRLKVDGTFKDIRVSNHDLPSGIYYYSLQTSKGSETKKMIVIK